MLDALPDTIRLIWVQAEIEPSTLTRDTAAPA